MNDLLLTISNHSIDWARAQFALTAIYHWLFVPLTLGLAVIMGIVETCWYRTRDTFWRDAAQFWQRLFGINFAMGVDIVGKKEYLQDDKDDEQLNQNDSPQGTS